MKIIVLGHKSFLAQELPYQKINVKLDGKKSSYYWLDIEKPSVIINCLGKTSGPPKNNIDWCEDHQFETALSNTIVPITLAEECQRRNIRLLHIGSGCIYYGPSPHQEFVGYEPSVSQNFDSTQYFTKTYRDLGWQEDDAPNPEPQSFYSRTKYATDLILSKFPNVAILRIRMPISTKPHPRNLLSKLIGYSDVLEQLNSVSFLGDVVNAINWVIENNKTGIYNVVSQEPILFHQLLDIYCKHFPDYKYNKITNEQLQKMVKAPRSNCVLSVEKIISEGFTFAPTHEQIEKYVNEFADNMKRMNK